MRGVLNYISRIGTVITVAAIAISLANCLPRYAKNDYDKYPGWKKEIALYNIGQILDDVCEEARVTEERILCVQEQGRGYGIKRRWPRKKIDIKLEEAGSGSCLGSNKSDGIEFRTTRQCRDYQEAARMVWQVEAEEWRRGVEEKRTRTYPTSQPSISAIPESRIRKGECKPGKTYPVITPSGERLNLVCPTPAMEAPESRNPGDEHIKRLEGIADELSNQ